MSHVTVSQATKHDKEEEVILVIGYTITWHRKDCRKFKNK